MAGHMGRHVVGRGRGRDEQVATTNGSVGITGVAGCRGAVGSVEVRCGREGPVVVPAMWRDRQHDDVVEDPLHAYNAGASPLTGEADQPAHPGSARGGEEIGGSVVTSFGRR